MQPTRYTLADSLIVYKTQFCPQWSEKNTMTKKRGRRKSRVSECSSDSAAITPAENVDIVDGLVPDDEWSNCLLDAYREESIHAWVRTKCELRSLLFLYQTFLLIHVV